MINWNARSYSEEDFRLAWLSAASIAECARFLNLNIYGQTYTTLKSAAKELGLTQDHMTGQGWSRGKTFSDRAPDLQSILINDPTRKRSSHSLKLRLIAENIKEAKCEICGLTDWMGKAAPLALDHIDGNHFNNELKNLRVICYNCHGQTETFCRRKERDKTKVDNDWVRAAIKASRQGRRWEWIAKCCYCNEVCRPDNYWHPDCLRCIDCEAPATNLRCRSCAGKAREDYVIEWPEKDVLIAMVKETNWLQCGLKLGVTDNAVRKHLRSLGVDTKNVRRFKKDLQVTPTSEA